ncbi:hypothetical protein [Thiomicrorhabdus sp. Milos-T2]|uniref:hypothetical protein n=1 Tax=Thiomicrorhabdus sp. Milos-T2 TaxID=90814 RepID=UPI000493DE91|nr:hypothetical protein [Thiomicrorhabdus sp. Milos-T2]
MSHQSDKTQFPKTLLQKQIESAFLAVNIELIAHQLGYKLEAFQHRLSKHLNNSFLGLDQSSFDFKYSGAEFLKALATELKIGQKVVIDSLDCIDRFLSKCQQSKVSLFVVTDFDISKRRLPIFALACLEHKRRKTFGCDEFIDNKTQMLDYVSFWVIDHYQHYQGVLDEWGEIQSYLYTNEDGDHFHFSPKGYFHQIKEDEKLLKLSKASVSI